jgi:hypothetical protein
MERGIRQQQLKIIKSITVLWFCKLEHPATQATLFLRAQWIITQSATLQCLLLDYSSNKSNKKRWKWPPWLYKRCHKLTPTIVAGVPVTHNMAKGIEIARLMSANMTHSTKVFVVNLMECIPTAIWCWAWGGKRSTLQQWWFWCVPWQLQ